MSKRPDLIELIRRKISMSQKIISDVDAEYANYVGSGENGNLIAILDWILKNRETFDVSEDDAKEINLVRSLFIQFAKADFVNLYTTEITKLGFLLGDTTNVIKAKRDKDNV